MTSCLHITGLLSLVVVVEGLPITCTDIGEKPQFFDGTECVPCPACGQGYGLSEICGNGQGVNAVCRVCPQGHFSDDDSMEMCRSCRMCSNTMEDAVNCTSTSDRKCGQCSCGYFRYQKRDDHCARCEDENYSDNYDECLLPCPTPTPSIQEPVNIVTTEEPTKRPTSLDPVFVIVIVVLGLVLILIIVVVCLLKNNSVSCGDQYEPVPSGSTEKSADINETVITHDEDQQTTSNGCPNITEGSLQKGSGSTNTTTEVVGEPQKVCQEDVVNNQPKVDKDSQQGATPLCNSAEGSPEGSANGSGILNLPEDPTESPDSHVESSSQGSRHSGTQAEPTEAEFDSKFQQALVATKVVGEPQIVCQEDVVNNQPKDDKDSQQGATPLSNSAEGRPEGSANGSGILNLPEDPTESPDSHVESSSRGSRHSGTQAEPTKAEFDSKFQQALVATQDIELESTHPEDKALLKLRLNEKPELMEGACTKDEFNDRFKQALVATRDIELDSMHQDDVALLKLTLHEKPELMMESMRFHYGRLAELFGFNVDEIRTMKNVEDVLYQVAAKRKERFTVANLLDKLEKSGKCYCVVWKLVKQIVERQPH